MFNTVEMANAVQPDATTVQELSRKSRSWWSSYVPTDTDLKLPVKCTQLHTLLGKAPAFPPRSVSIQSGLSTLRYHHSPLGLQISGSSTWCTSQGQCHLPPKTLRHQLFCGFHRSVSCSFADGSPWSNWPGVQDEDGEGNHLAILLLAWAYVLSARWVEIQLQSDTMHYSDLQAPQLDNEEDIPTNTIEINIGAACARAVRWWAAVLAPDEGWYATTTLGDQKYRSPWSAHVTSDISFTLRSTGSALGTHTKIEAPLTSDEALDYLQRYCDLHDINSQCIPALAASLFIPWKSSNRRAPAVLPLPKPARLPARRLLQQWPSGSCQRERSLLPYYMTLSCNIWGLRALLFGSFFDPDISCNLVSSWMQPIFEIIDPIIAREEVTSLAIIMSKRQPALAALWVGAIIWGMEKTILQQIRGGHFAVELHAAVWTGTVHTFINTSPINSHVTSDKDISRLDECRLLYLTGSIDHQRAPICPWKPFGTIPLDLADVEVRHHATCSEHCLQYVSWRWDTEDGLSHEDRGFDGFTVVDRYDAGPFTEIAHTSAPTQEQNLTISENATRSIFRWLRVDGYPPIEEAVFQHEWFDDESSDDGELASSDDESLIKDQGDVTAWLSAT